MEQGEQPLVTSEISKEWMAITEDKQRFIDAPGNHAQNVGKQSNESSWQDEAPTGAPAAKRDKAVATRRWREEKVIHPNGRNH